MNELLDAQFECGCWFSDVGAQRHPAIKGVMCCPVHRKPYGDTPARRPFVSASEPASEQDVSLLVRALGQRLPIPGGITDLDCLEAATRIKAALAAARGLRRALDVAGEKIAHVVLASGCTESEDCENSWHYWRCPKYEDTPDWSKCTCRAGPSGIHASWCALAMGKTR